MIVSNTHRFVFAHVPKTGGISIRSVLEPFANGQSAVLRDTTHETLPALLARVPGLGDFYKFAFVRNPWDRLVSFHAYAREKLCPTVPEMQGLDFGQLLRLMDRGASWLDRLYALQPQSGYVCGADFVGRFETLESDFARVCASLDIRAALPRKNTSGHGSYASYYDAWGRDFVARHYANDIDQFDYAFEANA